MAVESPRAAESDSLKAASLLMQAAGLEKAAFYKHWFGKLIMAIVLMILLLGGLGGVVAYQGYLLAQGKREYFTVDNNGRIAPIQAVSDPVVSQGQLLERFKVCVSQANDYNFVDYQKRLGEAQECFTENGWEQFAAALTRSGALTQVREQRLIVSSVATGPAVVVRRGVRKGVFTWEVQMPIQLTYQGGADGKSMATQRQIVTAMLERTNENKSSVGIAQYVVQEQ
ncbi:DotI/IcmL/TraM family protein [Pseudoxanthomonas kaohsiungensis]|uniref:DotI/IcmL/TraM family protein n=1 Tax=Pseudoxanthomonas kaohsiungensis TaxID=283923 RepID=A0ABW3LZ19_9GAMM|nr:DotI/IcmL/TraM family protein [Pseudoxanthomonas kaohsiungensis]